MEVRIINGKLKLAAYVVGIIAIIGLIGGGVYYVAQNYEQGSIAPGDTPGDDTTPTGETNFSDGPWSSNQVKKNVQLKDLNGDFVSSATIYKFSEKPTTGGDNPETVWCGMERDDVSTYRDDADKIKVSGNTTPIEDYPGKYYLYIESSGKYSECATMTIPDGDDKDVPLHIYEKDPDFVRPAPVLVDHYKPTGLSVDLGIDKTTTANRETWSEHAQVDPDDGTESRFEEIVASVGDVDYTTDADNDRPSDEGIQSLSLDLEGNAQMSKRIYYYPDGVDELDDSNEFTWDVDDVVATADKPVDVGVNVETWNTTTTGAADGDEALTDGENFLDLVIHFDNGGKTSAIDVTG